MLCRHGVTSVADSVKKFGGARAPSSPEPSRVSRPKPPSKKPELKPTASPALEAKATPAIVTTDEAVATTGELRIFEGCWEGVRGAGVME